MVGRRAIKEPKNECYAMNQCLMKSEESGISLPPLHNYPKNGHRPPHVRLGLRFIAFVLMWLESLFQCYSASPLFNKPGVFDLARIGILYMRN